MPNGQHFAARKLRDLKVAFPLAARFQCVEINPVVTHEITDTDIRILHPTKFISLEYIFL